MIKVYESVFNRKIDHFRKHPNYSKLRKSADNALKAHIGYGAGAIAAAGAMPSSSFFFRVYSSMLFLLV